MTEQEAIKALELNGGLEINGNAIRVSRFFEGLDMAIKALEKQIPKKPDLEGDGYADGHLVYDTWICPNCEHEYEVDYEEYDWCPNCGQHIDWSE